MVNPTKDNFAPAWLKPMMEAKYFKACSIHANEHKNECNMFCLDCIGDPLCTLCSGLDHQDHNVLQIRRSSYQDVVRADELEKYADISMVQTYVLNSAKIVFLTERPQSRPSKTLTTHCENCFRGLHDSSFRFCCLRCKMNGIKNGASDLTFSLQGNETESALADPSTQPNKKSRTADCSDSAEKPSSSEGVVAPPKNSNSRKRKGVPRRAPFF